jgi:outer membrane protein insertion porin family
VTNNLGSTPSNSYIQQDGNVGEATIGATLNRRDVDIDPSRGDWLHVETDPGFADVTKVGGAVVGQQEAVLGTSAFAKGLLEYRRYWSPDPPRGLQLDAPRRVVATRIRLGSISGNIPFFEQWFVGGEDSIRGYDVDRWWGKYMALATVEYRQPIQKQFNVIGFIDYGDAWGGYGSVNGFTQTNNPDFQVGYGVGLSFRTPLGPIRIDLGFDEQGKSRAYFQIATSF